MSDPSPVSPQDVAPDRLPDRFEDLSERINILLIRTGGIAAFIQTLRAFAAIRMHHGGACITLVTEAGVADFARTAPYFDAVEVGGGSVTGLRKVLRKTPWNRVYDLDCSPRTARAYKKAQTWRQRFGLDKTVEWSGTAKGCALPHTNPSRTRMHVSDRTMDQLSEAGLTQDPPVSMAWVSRAVGTFSLPVSLSDPFVLMSIDPGGLNGAQWSLERCIELAELISAAGHRVVLVGEQTHEDIAEAVIEVLPEAVNLCGKATHVEVVFLAWAAVWAVGYDNGLMHVITTAGCKSIVLYDPGSDAALAGHRGPDVTILRRHSLDAISAVEVMHGIGDMSVA